VDQVIPLQQDIPQETITRMMTDLVAGTAENNATAAALARFYHTPAQQTPLQVIPFSSQRRYVGAEFAAYGLLLLGAPERVLPELSKDLRAQAEQQMDTGSRVLLLVQQLPGQERRPLAFVCLNNPLRPRAQRTLHFFRRQGVAVKFLSGDDPRTVAAAARRAGMPEDIRVVDASKHTDEELAALAEETTVFGRVSPEQKRTLIRAIKSQHHTVAMIGDGVNDVLALKEADCGAAMAAGSDAARQVSQLVLLNNSFDSFPLVVVEGRRVVNNITRAASLFLVKTMFSFLLTVLTLFTGAQYPFMSIQLALLGCTTVGIPSFFLALEPNRTRITGSFMKKVLTRALPGSVSIVLMAYYAKAMAALFCLPDDLRSMMTLWCAGAVGLSVLLRVCMPLTRRRLALWALCFVAFYGAALVVPGLLFSAIPRGISLWLTLAGMVLSYPLVTVLEKPLSHLFQLHFWEKFYRFVSSNHRG